VGVCDSHELRTPMACIIGLLDMLLTKNLSSEHEGSIRQIHRCATSLVALLNSALDITKVESGKLVLEKAPFDLEAELSALIDVFSVQCDNKGLSLALQLAGDSPLLFLYRCNVLIASRSQSHCEIDMQKEF
jgi:signal transduction histidine kinase